MSESMMGIRHGLALVLVAGLGAGLRAQAPAGSGAPPVTGEAGTMPREDSRFTVVDGYLVAHLPRENVTVVARQAPPQGEDHGWASWSQRGQLLWRGTMEDSQGRSYNVRILPGYVAPLHTARDGWSEAGTDLTEYVQASTWNDLGRNSRACIRWGWKDAFWKFGLKGSGEAWSGNFAAAQRRTDRKTFGWPLAYPWALLSSTFETLLRVPLGLAGGGGGTATGLVIVPAFTVAAPALKATWHAAGQGVILPVAAWSWQTVAGTTASLFASAPTPSRADGVWMRLESAPSAPAPAPADRTLGEGSLELLSAYAREEGQFRTAEAEARHRDQAEREALQARQREARRVFQEARDQRLLAWTREPGNRKALQDLLQQGGDRASLQASRAALEKRLVAQGMTPRDAAEAVEALVNHPLMDHPPVPAPRPAGDDKTDPVKGALDTVDRVTREFP